MFITRFFWIVYIVGFALFGMVFLDVPRLFLLTLVLVPLVYALVTLVMELLVLEAEPNVTPSQDTENTDHDDPDHALSFSPLKTITPIASGFHPSRLYMLASVIGSRLERSGGGKDLSGSSNNSNSAKHI
ncbi:hypothetical protein [uncultured Cohaesibacter sp.]|uniref:hypothetical protein n=1 Tax=uncultured Cohaesibacter sp. TaxID=1002546 RepID=UPI0029C69BA7|nr:hypothetical protein [uncultured Cohaesibacter sp.]